MLLTNKNDHNNNYTEIFEELVKQRFDEIKELTNEIDHNDLTYYFKGNTVRKRLDDFNNVMEIEVKQKEAKNYRMSLIQI